MEKLRIMDENQRIMEEKQKKMEEKQKMIDTVYFLPSRGVIGSFFAK